MDKFEKFLFFGSDRKERKKQPKNPCVVQNCDSKDDGIISYHGFPKSGEKIVIAGSAGKLIICNKRKIWEDRLCIDGKISKCAKVCSAHFTDDDFIHKSKGKHKRLKRIALPSVNLPEEINLTPRSEFSGHILKINKNLVKSTEGKDAKNSQPVKPLGTEDKIDIINLTEEPDDYTIEVIAEPEDASIEAANNNVTLEDFSDEVLDALFMCTTSEMNKMLSLLATKRPKMMP